MKRWHISTIFRKEIFDKRTKYQNLKNVKTWQ